MKFLKILAVLVVLIALAIHFGWLQFEFTVYSLRASDAAATSTAPSRDVEDVRALRRAAAGGSSSAPVAVYRLLDRASALGTRSGAKLLRRRLPRLAASVDRELPVVQGRVRSLGIQTSVGWACREVALHLLTRERRVFRGLSADLAGTAPTWTAVDRFRTRVSALQRWYGSELRSSCLAQASPQDRVRVRRAMYQF